MRVAFLHPDLGLGGAERLVVDAAVELVQHGHVVDVYTAYYDPARCFEETRGSGGFQVFTAGTWFPRQIAGRLMALCAYIRCILVAIHIAFFAKGGPYDVVFIDQVSAPIPVVKALTKSKVLFYCHFPDMLLTQRASPLKKLYRAPLDWLEQTTTGQADQCLVNSRFTAQVFGKTFSRLAARGVRPEVLHPAVPVPSDTELDVHEAAWRTHLPPDLVAWMEEGPLLLSINRFERKKDIGLSIRALALFVKGTSNPQRKKALTGAPTSQGVSQTPSIEKGPCPSEGGLDGGKGEMQRGSGNTGHLDGNSGGMGNGRGGGGGQGGGEEKGDGVGGEEGVRLLLAGGYDARIRENVEYLEEMKALVKELGLEKQVRFLPSFTDSERAAILAGCTAVVYTPQNEHFGIVPIEAMAARRPVVAVNSGGPLESVAHGVTGFLCDPIPSAFAQAYGEVLKVQASDAKQKTGAKGTVGSSSGMGRAARERVEAFFSRKAFGIRLDNYVRALAGARQKSTSGESLGRSIAGKHKAG